jgi:hypothetical protein
MREVFLLAFTAALNPTLLTATTVMLLLPGPKRLMFGYWLGAMTASVTIGLVVVFALQSSGAVNTTKRTLSPAADLALGGIFLLGAVLIGTGRDRPVAERRSRLREGKGPPRWQRTLSRGTPRTTFVVGMLLTLPGASYLAGLARISKLDYPPATTVVAVVAFNVVMLMLLEAPLIALAVAPEWAVATIDRAKAWVAAHGRRFATRGLALVAAALLVKGTVELLQ